MISTNPASAKAAWDTIETIFQENKRTRIVALKETVRTKVTTEEMPSRFSSNGYSASTTTSSSLKCILLHHLQHGFKTTDNFVIARMPVLRTRPRSVAIWPSRYKARLVANGSTQLAGIDVDETFSPVVKPATIRTVLSLAISRHWPVHQLDVKNAFLHGSLSETVYMHQPPGFRDPQHPDHVCLLQRSLYGLKQAPRAWFQRFAAYAARVGFHHSRCDSSLFIYRQGADTAYLLLYVDDIVLTASSSDLLQQIITSLHAEFSMTGFGVHLITFWAISVTRNASGMFLSQQKYATEVIDRAGMLNCKPCRTPVDTDSKTFADGALFLTLRFIAACTGHYNYLTFTRPDISYAVQHVCLFRHDPREPHLSALKRILRYVRGTLSYGLQLYSSTTSSLVKNSKRK
ncbi:ribonuclease H-like domain-containing protein [Tanacetum coccineum]